MRRKRCLTLLEKTANLKRWYSRQEILETINKTYKVWERKLHSVPSKIVSGDCPLCMQCMYIRRMIFKYGKSYAGYSHCNYCPVVIINDIPCFDMSDIVNAEQYYPHYQTAVRNILHQLNILTLEIAKLED